jgi:hypothetical protein
MDIAAFDGGSTHTKRRNKLGRVPKSQKPQVIVTNDAELAAYIKRKKKLVGYTKSGWITAGKQISTYGLGQVAGWIKRHNAPGRGTSGPISADARTAFIRLENGTQWASYTTAGINGRLMSNLESMLAKQIETILIKHIAKRRG